jgi:GntR family transcriptional regulator / MocR family aminotransferase
MARWEFPIAIDRAERAPLFIQISRAIVEDIDRGRLKAGHALPGTRTLARSLGVQRQTVVAAYDELSAEGWIVTERARGTFVSRSLPDPKPRRLSLSARTGLPAATRFSALTVPQAEDIYPVPRGALFFAPTRPDVRLAPADMIGRAYRRAIRRGGGRLLSYAPPYGHPRLRSAIAAMVAARRGVPASIDNICVTRGSQMAIALIALALVHPGDIVAVEHLGYRAAWEAFRLAGADVVGVPVDADGIDVKALEHLHNTRGVRAIYLTPHHQLPTTVTLAATRRLQLLDLAARNKIAIVEDDYDHEFHYDGRPVMPLMSSDDRGVVLYVGSLSKVLAPALRIGYLVAPATFVDKVAALRSFVDAQGDQVLEYAIADLLEDGDIQRHVRRMRVEYGARRDVLVEALRRTVGDAVDFRIPAGGVGLWVRATGGADVEAWAARSRERGAVVITAKSFAFDRAVRPFFRFGFAALTPFELREAVKRFAAARTSRL